MSTLIRKYWPIFFITAFLLLPKISFAADWVNIGFADKNVKIVYADPNNNKHISISLVSYIDGSYNYYTEDGGSTWSPINTEGILTQCNDFTLSPTNKTEFWAACSSGLFHSTDAGRNFSKLKNQSYSNLTTVKVLNNGNIIAGAPGGTLAMSTDGILWSYANAPGNGSNPYLYLSPFDPNTLYLYNNYYGAVTFTKTSDGGHSWNLLSTKQDLNNANNFYFLSKSKICVSRNSMFACSEDGGSTWGTFSYIDDNKNYDSVIGIQNPDEPNNILMYLLRYSDGSAKLYMSEDGAQSWKLSTGMPKLSSLGISQGTVFGWSQNSNWNKGIWRNDGIAVIPEYLKKHPVIIVPGILGSWEKFGNWQLDPLLHTYTDLVNTLIANGLVLNKDVFLFPYNWRLDNAYTATLLKQKIDEAKVATGANKVDIVAHSMGGLVARSYAESDGYQNDIDQIVFLGTPHLGSPEAYPVWEAGDLSFNKTPIVSTILKYIFSEEASNSNFHGENSVLDYIRADVPSVQQLLPVYDYLGWYSNGLDFSYPLGYPRNLFLETLDSRKDLIEKENIRVTNIITDNITTPSGFGLSTNNSNDGKWQEGVPYLYYSSKEGINSCFGDKTVPLISARGLEGEESVVSNIEHGDLPTQAIESIFKALDIQLNSKPSLTDNVKKFLFVSAYSPVDFYVLTPESEKIGFNKDGEEYNDVKDAFYTGNNSAEEFVIIPNPTDGEYKIVTFGTGSGGYKIEASYSDNEKNYSTNVIFSGVTKPLEENGIELNLDQKMENIRIKNNDSLDPQNLVNPVSKKSEPLTIETASSSQGLTQTIKEIIDNIFGEANQEVLGSKNIINDKSNMPVVRDNTVKNSRVNLYLILGIAFLTIIVINHERKNSR